MERKARAASKNNTSDSDTDVTPSFTSSSAETDMDEVMVLHKS